MNQLELVVEPGRHDIVMTRMFDAPRHLVFQALTDPSLIPSWWSTNPEQTTVDRAEIRPGGSWRYVNHDDDGNEYAFHGVVHDVVTPERIVQTFEYEGMPGHVCLETVTLEDVDGKTRYRALSVFQSIEDRDGMVQSGMEIGARENFDRLEKLAQGLS
jgi:uncharacterized protein YndB with AHSA1/START domain